MAYRPHVFQTLAAATAAMAIGAHQAQAAPMLITSGGVLTGVNDLMVGGKTFDVQFETGSCSSVFPAICGPGFGSSVFIGFGAGNAAVNALGSIGLDSFVHSSGDGGSTAQIRGCDTATMAATVCEIFVPVNSVSGGQISGTVFDVAAPPGPDGTGFFGVGASAPLGTNQTFAAFTPATAVPEPGTAALVLVGAVGVAGVRSRKKRACRG